MMPSPVPDSPGLSTYPPPCTWISTRSRFASGMFSGVSTNTLTPPITLGSDLTPNRSRSAGMSVVTSAARRATSAFHSSADFGCASQIGDSGAPIRTCAAGLAVLGTGMSRAGTCRVPASSATAGVKARTAKRVRVSGNMRVLGMSIPPPVSGLLINTSCGSQEERQAIISSCNEIASDKGLNTQPPTRGRLAVPLQSLFVISRNDQTRSRDRNLSGGLAVHLGGNALLNQLGALVEIARRPFVVLHVHPAALARRSECHRRCGRNGGPNRTGDRRGIRASG